MLVNKACEAIALAMKLKPIKLMKPMWHLSTRMWGFFMGFFVTGKHWAVCVFCMTCSNTGNQCEPGIIGLKCAP